MAALAARVHDLLDDDQLAALPDTDADLWADLVDAHHANHPRDDFADVLEPRTWLPRTWDGATPDHGNDASTGASTDPFRYADQNGSRPRPAQVYPRPNNAAWSLARRVCEHGTPGQRPGELLEEQLAVYEWALATAGVFRNSVGRIVPGYSVFASTIQGREFLSAYRAARAAETR